MRFKTSGIALVLLLSLIAGVLMMALGPALAGQAYLHPYYQNPFYSSSWYYASPYTSYTFQANNYYNGSNWQKFYNNAGWYYASQYYYTPLWNNYAYGVPGYNIHR